MPPAQKDPYYDTKSGVKYRSKPRKETKLTHHVKRAVNYGTSKDYSDSEKADSDSSTSGTSEIIVDSAAHPTHWPYRFPGMTKAKHQFTLTETNERTSITHYGKLIIPITHGQISTKSVSAPVIKEKLLSVRELTDSSSAVIFTNENVYLTCHNKLDNFYSNILLPHGKGLLIKY